MKIRTLLVLLAAIAFGIHACNKENSPSPATVQSRVTASKTSSIQRGEPVVFSMNHPASDTVSWSVAPAASAQVVSHGDSATISFQNPGRYQVKGQSGNVSGTISLQVDSSWYDSLPPAIPDSTASLNGDQVQISVTKFNWDIVDTVTGVIDSMTNSGLTMTFTTLKSYPCTNSLLNTNLTINSGDVGLNFISVIIPGSDCTPGTGPASTWTNINPIPNGTHKLTIQLNGKSYTGSYTRNGNSYNITWPYTSGVTISPLTIN